MYFVKLPQGEWVNLASDICGGIIPPQNRAQVRTVEVEESNDSLVPDINHLLVRLLFDTGKSKAYSGVKAVALLEALTETPYIDKSQISA